MEVVIGSIFTILPQKALVALPNLLLAVYARPCVQMIAGRRANISLFLALIQRPRLLVHLRSWAEVIPRLLVPRGRPPACELDHTFVLKPEPVEEAPVLSKIDNVGARGVVNAALVRFVAHRPDVPLQNILNLFRNIKADCRFFLRVHRSGEMEPRLGVSVEHVRAHHKNLFFKCHPSLRGLAHAVVFGIPEQRIFFSSRRLSC